MINEMTKLLHLLQLASPALPVGAYSYSEGLETLVDKQVINSYSSLADWLEFELKYGSIVVETAVMLRAYGSLRQNNLDALATWNAWLSATRETEELRQQSWQMGRSLRRLLVDLQPQLQPIFSSVGNPCNYAVAFGIAAAHWEIKVSDGVLAYLQSWLTNLIGAGIKLIPLGQTDGQKILLSLHPLLQETSQKVVEIGDENLASCSWGLGLASMAHQKQYSRLFRS